MNLIPALMSSALLTSVIVTTALVFVVLAALTGRAKKRRNRLQKNLAMFLRLESEWKNARTRMYLAGPMGTSKQESTKYTNSSTNRDFVRYIGG